MVVKLYARMDLHIPLKSCSLERQFIPVPDMCPKKITGARLTISSQCLQLFLWVGRPPKFLSPLLGLSQGPITHFQIYFYWDDLLSSKLNTPKMAPTDYSPDFHVSHISTHLLGHVNPPNQKINDISPSFTQIEVQQGQSVLAMPLSLKPFFAFFCLHV